MLRGTNSYSFHFLEDDSGSIKLIFPSELVHMGSVIKEYFEYRFSTMMIFQRKNIFLKQLMEFDKEQKLPIT